jgi:transketolase
MCLHGKIPLLASYAAFNAGRKWDQLRVSVCYSNHNVKVLGGHAGLTTGPDGATHQALEDIAITRVIPNLDVIIPCDEIESKKATLAMFQNKNPTYLRVSREKSLNITTDKSKFEIGKVNVLDSGSDVTIIACGIAVQFALEAKELLLKENIDATVLNLHTVCPIDEKAIVKYAKLTGAIVTAEEHQINGGMGSAVSEVLCRKYPTPQEFVGVKNTFGESGDGYELLKKYSVSVAAIVKASKKVIARKQ